MPFIAASYHYDDMTIVQTNALLRDSARWGEIWRGQVDSGGEMNGVWRPLLLTIFSVIGQLFGFSPIGFRVVSVLLHFGNGLALAAIGRKLFHLPASLAIVVAGVFLFHPVHVSTLSQVWKQSDLWVAAAAFASILLWSRKNRMPRWMEYGIPLFLFLAALAMKESAVVIPLFWLALDPFLPSENRTERRADAGIALALYAAYFFLLREYLPIPPQLDGIPASRVHYFLTELSVIPMYAKALLWPPLLTIDRSVPLRLNVQMIDIIRLLLAFWGVAALLWNGFRKSPTSSALLLAAIWLIPTSSFQPLSLLYDETRLYVVVAGGVLALACMISRSGGMPVRPFLQAVLVASMAAVFFHQARIWSSPRQVWEGATRVDPTSARAHYQLGVISQEERALDEAELHYRSALRLTDSLPQAELNLGIVLGRKGDLTGAEKAFLGLLEREPYWAVRGLYHLGLGAMYRREWDQARQRFDEVARIDPKSELAEKGRKILRRELAMRKGVR